MRIALSFFMTFGAMCAWALYDGATWPTALAACWLLLLIWVPCAIQTAIRERRIPRWVFERRAVGLIVRVADSTAYRALCLSAVCCAVVACLRESEGSLSAMAYGYALVALVEAFRLSLHVWRSQEGRPAASP